MVEETGEHQESPQEAKFREYVTSEKFIQLLPGLKVGDTKIPSKLISHDDSNQFAIVEEPRSNDAHDKRFSRYHFAEDPTTGLFRERGNVTVTNNTENPAFRNIFVEKSDEDNSFQQDVSYLRSERYERLDVNLGRPSPGGNTRPVIEISASYNNNHLDAFKYIPRDKDDPQNPGWTVFTKSRGEIDALAQEGPIIHTVKDKQCSFERVVVDGISKLKVSYSVGLEAIEELYIPIEVSLEDVMHELAPQEVQRFPESAPAEADLFMDRDMPEVIFGENWHQPIVN